MATPEEFQGSSTGGVHILNGIAQFLISCLASSNNCLIYIFRLRPRPHVYVFMRKRRFFCSFSPSVHTQTLIQRFRKSPFSPKTFFENGFESGDFRKRCVVVWTGENGDFWITFVLITLQYKEIAQNFTFCHLHLQQAMANTRFKNTLYYLPCFRPEYFSKNSN